MANEIYLLDLNYTLVANSRQKRAPFARQVEAEAYRQWLVELLRPERVILVTARPVKYAALTLASIQEKTGWLPADAYFNEHNLRPPLSKRRALRESIFPKYGADALYFAIESNPQTAAMYAEFGIPSVKVMEDEEWETLPRRA